ncbi:hypothetical protein DMB90_08720 [Raoultella planticola]|uniref:Uncharacterized protein n=1 Tax=Raoultella planticola TaxID=575 RepID=A0A5P6A9K5_RAOPL|nr:hypothetical protein DMB90_08720 [Raoultella planticola]
MATADGYEVAAVLKEEDPGRLHKIAAMTSSLLGVGAAMLNEIDAGGQKAITVEGEGQYPALAGRYAAFSIMSDRGGLRAGALGQLFWLLRQLAAAIAEICHAQPDLPPPQEYYYE